MRVRIVFTTVVAAGMMLPTGAADTVSFDVRGVEIGAAIDPATHGLACSSEELKKSGKLCFADIQVADKTLSMAYMILDGALASVSLGFPSDSYAVVVDAYTDKFGVQPHEKKNEELVTRMGARFTNEIVVWHTDAGEFVIKKYGRNVSNGRAMLMNDGLRAFFERRKAEKAGALSKGL